jgi:hypothetical protein
VGLWRGLGTVGERLSCMRFELATGQSSAQTMSESDDEIQIGVVPDNDNIGSDVRASACTSKPGKNPWQPKLKQKSLCSGPKAPAQKDLARQPQKGRARPKQR